VHGVFLLQCNTVMKEFVEAYCELA
jgi:hypothetical protein